MVKIAIIVVSVIVIIKIGMHYLTNMMLYAPGKTIDSLPEEFGLDYEEINFNSANGKKLNGLFFASKEAKVTIILFHGNGENIGDRLDFIKLILGLKVNIFVFDYQGYGRSEGVANEQNTYDDAMAAYNFVKKREHVDPEFITLFGRSLGGAIAIDLATKVKCYRLITEGAFSSLKDMGKFRFPYTPIYLFAPNKYNNLVKILNINTPALIVHGTEDETIPFQQGAKLFDTAKEPKEFYRVEGAGHNDVHEVAGDSFLKTIKQFLNL